MQRAGGEKSTNAWFGALADLHAAQFGKSRMLGSLPTGSDLDVQGVRPLQSVDAQHWSWLGPRNVGGRTRALVVDPELPSRIWAASPAGGIWVTEDSGASWQPVDDEMATLAISALVMKPGAHDELYAGSGEGFDKSSPTPGVGIFKSSDRGRTWTRLPNTTDFAAINRLAFTSDGAVLLAANADGILRSIDAGATWQNTTIDEKPATYSVTCSPTKPNECVAGQAGAALYTEDAGATWKRASGLPSGERVELAYARAKPNVVYATIATCSGFLFRSDDGGRTFAVRDAVQPCLGEAGWYSSAVWAGDPSSENVVVVGGFDLFRSTDGGNHLEAISNSDAWPNAIAHPDYHVIVEDPRFGTNSQSLYIGNDGGVFRIDALTSVSPTGGWTPLNTGYGVTQFYSISVGPHGEMLGGTQDNATQMQDSGASDWHLVLRADGGFTAIDSQDPRYLYAETQNLGLARSNDGGKHWDDITGWDEKAGSYKDEAYVLGDAQNQTALFIAPFVLDPNAPTRLLAGGASLWRSDDVRADLDTTPGPRWTEITQISRSFISAIAVTPGNSADVWYCDQAGSVFHSKNATSPTPTWERIDRSGSPLPNRYCTHVTVDPHNAKRVFVAFGGSDHKNLWRTIDGGTSWTPASGNLPLAPVRDVVFNPTTSNTLYAATEVGVYVSDNGGNSWVASNQGPIKCPVFDLEVAGGYLYAATFGRGVYRIKL